MAFSSPKKQPLHLPARLGEAGFSTILVIVISAIVSAAMLGVLQLSVYNAQTAERAIAFSQFALMNQQISAMLKPMADSFYGGANNQNACTLALGGQQFNTATGTVSPNLTINNESGVFLDAADGRHNTFGKLTVTGINLVSQGQPDAADNTVYRARMVITARMTNVSPFDRVFRNDVNTSQDIWVLVKVATPGSNVAIQSCTSNFFLTSASPVPVPLPICNKGGFVGEVLYADEPVPNATGVAASIRCIRAICSTGAGWKQAAGFAADGNAICM